MRPTAILVVLAACGSSSPAQVPTPPSAAAELPMLLDRPIADSPLSAGPAQVAHARAAASLAEPLPKLEGSSTESWKQEMTTWTERRSQLLRDINNALAELSAPQRDGLSATLIVGVALDDLVQDLVGLPIPASLRDGPFANDVEAAYRASLEERARTIAARAKEQFARCTKLVAEAPAALRVWADHCRAREAELAALEARVAARPASTRSPASPAVMKDCSGGEKSESEPDALPPDMKVKPRLVVLFDDQKLDEVNRKRFRAEVMKRVSAHAKLPMLSAKDIAAGEKLVTQRRMTPKGPVCGQAPRLTQVLSTKHRHLVVARAATQCTFVADGDKKECGVRVWFKRGGTWEDDGVPESLFAPIDGPDVPPGAWISAAPAHSPKSEADVFGVLGALRGGPTAFSLKNYGDDDPWLRLSETLYGATATKIASCVDAAASFDVKLSISPTGTTTEVALAAVTKPPSDSRVSECVRDALKATAFPCTRDGKPAVAELRMCVAPATPAPPM